MVEETRNDDEPRKGWSKVKPASQEEIDMIGKMFGVDLSNNDDVHNDVLTQLKKDGEYEKPLNTNQLLIELQTRPEKVEEYINNMDMSSNTTASDVSSALYNRESMRNERVKRLTDDIRDTKVQMAGYKDVGQEVPRWLNKKMDKLVKMAGDELAEEE